METGCQGVTCWRGEKNKCKSQEHTTDLKKFYDDDNDNDNDNDDNDDDDDDDNEDDDEDEGSRKSDWMRNKLKK